MILQNDSNSFKNEDFLLFSIIKKLIKLIECHQLENYLQGVRNNEAK